MNYRLVGSLLGWLLLMEGGFLCLPLLAAAVFGESVRPFVETVLAAVAIGLLLIRITRPKDRSIRPREGFLVVGGAWVTVSLVGALPYLLTAGGPGFADAVFESVSGFTTTGSTVIPDVTVLPRSLLLWRSMSQWLGGMGIILFTIAILPLLGIGGMQLFKAEVPGPVADKIQPRLASTARSLWGIYVSFTALEWFGLRIAGLDAFEALCHSFTTLATGGFSTRNASVGEFGSPAVEWIIIVFMLAAGINFVLHYKLITGRGREVLRDSELRYFLALVAAATVFFVFTSGEPGSGLGDTVRTSAFQAVSLITTTGYVTTDFEFWSGAALLAILVLMTLGGMSGSTGGGIKSLRTLLALRSLRATMEKLIHPRAVRAVKYGGAAVDSAVLSGIWAFFTAYLLIALVGAVVVALAGYDVLTSLSAAFTAVGNVGPGLGEVGAYDNFAHFPSFVKLSLAACMLFGRLEIFTLLAFFSIEFWRR